jgi:hypothetical protein
MFLEVRDCRLNGGSSNLFSGALDVVRINRVIAGKQAASGT